MVDFLYLIPPIQGISKEYESLKGMKDFHLIQSFEDQIMLMSDLLKEIYSKCGEILQSLALDPKGKGHLGIDQINLIYLTDITISRKKCASFLSNGIYDDRKLGYTNKDSIEFQKPDNIRLFFYKSMKNQEYFYFIDDKFKKLHNQAHVLIGSQISTIIAYFRQKILNSLNYVFVERADIMGIHHYSCNLKDQLASLKTILESPIDKVQWG
jgi:hypothetical protein